MVGRLGVSANGSRRDSHEAAASADDARGAQCWEFFYWAKPRLAKPAGGRIHAGCFAGSDTATRSCMPHVPLAGKDSREPRLERDGHQVGDPRLPVHLPILVPKRDSTA